MLKLAPYLPGDMAPSAQIYKAIAVNEEEEEEGDSEREREGGRERGGGGGGGFIDCL